jgi:hypothetical protein
MKLAGNRAHRLNSVRLIVDDIHDQHDGPLDSDTGTEAVATQLKFFRVSVDSMETNETIA